jgi:4-amino-4-deoxy-L-arabinose transferase-like glycosyltransferase
VDAPVRTSRSAWLAAAIAALAVLPGLWIGTLWDNSETIYGEVAREVLISRDPVVMHFNGDPWFVQPPLYFWVAALFAKLLGVTSFALRLPSALSTVGIVAGIAYAVGRARTQRAALFAALVASTMLMMAILGRLAIMDAMLDAAVTAAIGGLYAALRGGSIAWWYVAWIAMGLGTLTKGPVAVVIPVLVIVVWAAWERRCAALALPARSHWFAGIAVWLAIVAPWTCALAAAAGPAALSEMVGHYTFGRYVGTIENQAGPVWYYLPVLVLGAFPWFAFLPPAMLDGFAAARRSVGHLERLAIVWSAAPLIFFSLAQTKLPNYIALEFPALAILVGLWFDSIPRTDRRRSAMLWTLLVPLSLAVLGVAIVVFSRDNRLGAGLSALQAICALLGGVIFLGWLVMLVLLARRGTSAYAPYPLGIAGLVFVGIVAFIALPLADGFKPIPPLAAVIRQEQHSGDTIGIFGVRGGNALLFYTQPRIVAMVSPEEAARGEGPDARQEICRAPRAFVIMPRAHTEDPTGGRNRRRLAESNGDVLFLYDGPGCAAAGARSIK